MDQIDPVRLRMIVVNYERACHDVRQYARSLKSDTEQNLRAMDRAHTPGNLTRLAACLDAAREKAYTLRETLEALGQKPEPPAWGEP